MKFKILFFVLMKNIIWKLQKFIRFAIKWNRIISWKKERQETLSIVEHFNEKIESNLRRKALISLFSNGNRQLFNISETNIDILNIELLRIYRNNIINIRKMSNKCYKLLH